MKIYNESMNYYNLSYSFLHDVVGIDIRECYPVRDGYCAIDQHGRHYLIFKIASSERYRFEGIYDILRHLIEDNGTNILPMYSSKYRRCFLDEINNDYYVVFNYSGGIYKRWGDFKLEDVCPCLREFYLKSEDIIRYVYDSNLDADIGILTIGREIKKIDVCISRLRIIEDITKSKQNKNEMDKFFLSNSSYMTNELINLREFFRGSKFNAYAEDINNISFINGGLSNKSFIYDSDYKIANFHKSSVDLFVKDIAILIHNSLLHLDYEDITRFILNILKSFRGEIEEHLEVLVNYIRLQNYMFKCILEDYTYLPSLTRMDIQNKNIELSTYMDTQTKLISKISFT